MTKQAITPSSADKAEKKQLRAAEKVEKATAIKQARALYTQAKRAYKKATYVSRYTAYCCLHGDIGNKLLPEQQLMYDEMLRTESIWDTLRGGKKHVFKNS